MPRAGAYGIRMTRSLCTLALFAALAAAVPAAAQEPAEPAAEPAAEAEEEEHSPAETVVPQAGNIVLGGISVPVIRNNRVQRYEYATVGLHVGDTARLLPRCARNALRS